MKVVAYKAELTVSGTRYKHGNEDPFYLNVKNVYAETIPALYDEMVIVSKIMHDELQSWLAENNQSEELEGIFKQTNTTDGYVQWYFTSNRPELLKNVELDEEGTYGSGGAISRPRDIVESMVHYRYLDIGRAVWDLKRINPDLPEWEKDRSFYELLNSEDLTEVMSAGYSGAELQEYLNSIPETVAQYERQEACHARFTKRTKKRRGLFSF